MQITDLLNLALTTPVGLVVETPDPTALKQRLYAAKRKSPGLYSPLSFLTSRTNPETEIWIANAQAANPSAGTETGEDDPPLFR